MKKVSTAAAMQTKNFQEQQLVNALPHTTNADLQGD
jgi:hypothetical protein